MYPNFKKKPPEAINALENQKFQRNFRDLRAIWNQCMTSIERKNRIKKLSSQTSKDCFQTTRKPGYFTLLYVSLVI